MSRQPGWRRLATSVSCIALLAGAPLAAAADAATTRVWPELTPNARPWVRWWWPGSAVDNRELDRELEQFAAAGLGGVEITPIYGARGAESRDIQYLSARWVEQLARVGAQARRLGLGVDMATGTGWPFGGPRVGVADAASTVQFVDGRLSGRPTGMKVKRAAPGGEGWVLDPYSTDALARYLQPFTQALQPVRGTVRSQFHDSFEYYDASWSPELPRRFQQMHGYDLQSVAATLAGTAPQEADLRARIIGDYRRTLAALHVDYLRHWVRWAHEQGSLARNQAHGAPGRLLDLYGAADIPETESFGAVPLPIQGLTTAPGEIREDPDPPLNLIGRFASSAAHVMGRPLASSETLTWLRENFQESPAAAKPQLDRLFVAGINHIFYHGTSYSDPEAAWPGWYFYAATQLNPRNPLWRDYSAMHAYVARVQSVLQAGAPDNDILFYWPEADEQDSEAARLPGVLRQYGMHENAWLTHSDAGRSALQLLQAGYSLDFVSDEQLLAARASPWGLRTAAGTDYRVLVLPRTRRLPLETMAAVSALVRQGVPVVFAALPDDVPGYGQLAQRRAELQRLLAEPTFAARARVAADLTTALAPFARREALSAAGLWYVRRAHANQGSDYFVVNATGQDFRGWVHLSSLGRHVALLDPLTGDAGRADITEAGGRRVYLQLDSGQSLILRSARRPWRLAPWPYGEPAGAAVTLRGPWRLEFLAGGPTLPAPVTLDTLESWTRLPEEAGQRFSGTGRYRLDFDAPARSAEEWLLDLGELRETARIFLNGRELGTVWSLPARIRLGRLRPRDNQLVIDVTNLPANRIRDLELRQVDWKIMKDINLASLNYRSLDAAAWRPLPSGLLGPVRLVPLRIGPGPRAQ